MEMKWVIIARGHRLENRNLDIWNVLDQLTVYGRKNRFSIHIITKVHFNPNEAWENKKLTLQINHNKRGELHSYERQYQVPDFNTLLNFTTYIVWEMSDIEFQYEGIHTFKILVDGEYKNDESIDVIYAKGGR